MSKILICVFSLFCVLKGFAYDIAIGNPALYPCNAGIAQRAGEVCFVNDQVVKSCAGLASQNCSCVMPSAGDDYMNARIRNWNPILIQNFNEISNRYEGLCTVEENCSDRNQLAKMDLEGFNTLSETTGGQIIDRIDFSLGSDLFGTEYYVDICFKRETEDDQLFSLTALAVALEQSSEYANKAGLEVRYMVECNDGYSDSWSFTETPAAVQLPVFDPAKSFCIIRFNFKELNIGTPRTKVFLDSPFRLIVDII